VPVSLLVPPRGDTRLARLATELTGSGALCPPLDRLVSAVEPDDDRRPRIVERAGIEAIGALARAGLVGAVPLCRGNPSYPRRLSTLPDPPIVLWTRGDQTVLEAPAVAIVGSRRAATTSLLLARTLARDLAAAGLVVVSGLAMGVDTAAHEGALEGGGQTVAVLGAGVDVVYPRKNGGLVHRIVRSGCVVSELPPGTPPLPRHFPLRNRIISGLSLAVVVVEAAERSGSLITARLALEQGRDVLAVPGGVLSGCHRGCHALIKDGAGLVENAADVLAALGWSAVPSRNEDRPATGVLAAMKSGVPVTVDELVARTGRQAPALLAELGRLEIEGAVIRTGAGLFVRVDGPVTS